MKKTILLACLLGGMPIASAATPVEVADYSNMSAELFQRDKFSISFTIEELTFNEFVQGGSSPVVFSWMNWYAKDEQITLEATPQISGNGITEKYTWTLRYGFNVSDLVETQTVVNFPLSGTYVFHYEDLGTEGVSCSFSQLSADGSTLNEIVSTEPEHNYKEFIGLTQGVGVFDVSVVGGQSADKVSNITLWDGVVTAADLVPEPATATLSLLALAGLAARRRRK